MKSDFILAPLSPTLDMCRAAQNRAMRDGLALPTSAMAVLYEAMIDSAPEDDLEALDELYRLVFGSTVDKPSIADLIDRLRRFAEHFNGPAIDPEDMKDALAGG